MANGVIPTAMRQYVCTRAHGLCEYCFSPAMYSPGAFSVDHIIPSSLGGETVPDNLAYCCNGCNGHKFNKTHFVDPLTNQITRLYHPRQLQWGDHFKWSEDDLLILGITPIGRATVELLQVNRLSNINLRGLLKTAGLHPPK